MENSDIVTIPHTKHNMRERYCYYITHMHIQNSDIVTISHQ